jgi:hypothetical protein
MGRHPRDWIAVSVIAAIAVVAAGGHGCGQKRSPGEGTGAEVKGL